MQNADLHDLDLAGVKWELDNIPFTMRNIAAAATTTAPQTIAPGRSATQIVPPVSPIQTITPQIASAMAMRPTNIPEMLRMIAEFNHPLRGGCTNVVLPWIAPKPNGLLIITDIPGSDDDATGNLLSGPAGDLLDKMLSAIDMSRESVSLMPMLFWRTPGGRTPTREELDFARPFVNRIIEMIEPRIILTFGAIPAMEIGGIAIANTHGQIQTLDSGVKLMPVYHPNYMILKPNVKRDVWAALQTVQKLLKTDDK